VSPTNKIAADYKIFCDESCHQEHDGSDLMVFGALKCSAQDVERLIRSIKDLRQAHNYHTEIKWTKLIAKQAPFYRALIDLFIQSDCLAFKATVVLNKHLLDHQQYNAGSHNTFYYKMAFYALRDFLKEQGKVYRLYLDYMDTQGAAKASKLAEVLNTNMRGQVSVAAHCIRSHESQLIQLCDLFCGAVAYATRTDLNKTSAAKNEVIAYLGERLQRSLSIGTPPWEEKFNIFQFSPRKA